MQSSVQNSPTITTTTTTTTTTTHHHNMKAKKIHRAGACPQPWPTKDLHPLGWGLPQAPGPSPQNSDMHQAEACPRPQLTKHHCYAMGRGLPKAPAPQPPHLLRGANPTNSPLFGGWGLLKTPGHQTDSHPRTVPCMHLRIHPPTLAPTPIQTHTHTHAHTRLQKK